MTVWGFLDPMYWSSLNSVWILLNGVEIKFRSQETNILNLIASVSVPQYVTSDSILRTKISAGTTQGCENWISLSVIQKEICSLTLFPILTFFIRPRPVHRSGAYYGKACSVTPLCPITPYNSKSYRPILTIFDLWISLDGKTKTLVLFMNSFPYQYQWLNLKIKLILSIGSFPFGSSLAIFIQN